jgi:hypothetical protein
MRFLRKYVFPNILLKLLALSISMVLWATYTSEPYAEVGFPLALEFTSMPAQMEISGDVPTQVRVRVRGRSALLRRLTPSDLSLHVDLKDAKPGDTLVTVTPQMVDVPYGATVVGISPSEFHVTLVSRRESPPPAG